MLLMRFSLVSSQEAKLKWTFGGRKARRNDERQYKIILIWTPWEYKGKTGRPEVRWADDFRR